MMTNIDALTKAISLALMAGLLATLAGCGGGDNDDNKKAKNENNCFDNPLYFFLCLADASGDSSGNGSKANGSGTAANLATASEYEPNNVLNNANIVSSPVAHANAVTGLQLEGSLGDNNDAADFFIFTPSQSGSHTIRLCGDNCESSLKDDSVYIMVYDQNQTTIAATPIGTVASQQITAELTAGLAYYVEINGYNTGALNYSYKLAVRY
jgi:hypothetical protein